MKRSFIRLIAFTTWFLALAVIGVSTNSYAITVDLFEGSLSVTSSEVAGNKESAFSISAGAAGGDRQATVIQKSDGLGVTKIVISGGRMRFTLDSNEGEGIIAWDGDRNPNNADPLVVTRNGLGAVNLTQDGGDAFIIPLVSFDYPANKPVLIKLALFDALDVTRSSEVTITLNQAWIPTSKPFPLSVPFSLFSSPGNGTIAGPTGALNTNTILQSGGPVRLTSVGAVRLHMVGNMVDLFLGKIETNGRCSLVPNNKGDVVDQCGVCFDSPDANKGSDLCGVCFKGPPGYDYDANKVFDACGLCPGQGDYSFPSGTKDSCGICLSGQPPYTYKDQKDSCGLCPSHPNYQKAADPCGVCFGNGSSCADCSGTPNGGSRVDLCGVCGGNSTTCLDCAGVANGKSALDVCGVCGGDGKSCLDCNGIPFGPSKNDACSVCGGKSVSIDECTTAIPNCVIVSATKKVREFERTLVAKARTVRSRFYGERKRAKRSKCSINMTSSRQTVDAAFQRIALRSRQIFSSGVKVCGDSCITASYADEVEDLMPEFTKMQNATLVLAKQVKRCYAQSGIERAGGTKAPGVRDTVGSVNQGLTDLINRCRQEKVCPPGRQ